MGKEKGPKGFVSSLLAGRHLLFVNSDMWPPAVSLKLDRPVRREGKRAGRRPGARAQPATAPRLPPRVPAGVEEA